MTAYNCLVPRQALHCWGKKQLKAGWHPGPDSCCVNYTSCQHSSVPFHVKSDKRGDVSEQLPSPCWSLWTRVMANESLWWGQSYGHGITRQQPLCGTRVQRRGVGCAAGQTGPSQTKQLQWPAHARAEARSKMSWGPGELAQWVSWAILKHPLWKKLLQWQHVVSTHNGLRNIRISNHRNQNLWVWGLASTHRL